MRALACGLDSGVSCYLENERARATTSCTRRIETQKLKYPRAKYSADGDSGASGWGRWWGAAAAVGGKSISICSCHARARVRLCFSCAFNFTRILVMPRGGGGGGGGGGGSGGGVLRPVFVANFCLKPSVAMRRKVKYFEVGQ